MRYFKPKTYADYGNENKKRIKISMLLPIGPIRGMSDDIPLFFIVFPDIKHSVIH